MPPKGRLPWGAIGAAFLLVLFEIICRLVHPSGRVPGWSHADGYRAFRQEIAVKGSAEVAVLGSSRARESLVIPELKKQLKERLNKDVVVANYGLPGAAAVTCELVLRELLSRTPTPRFVLWGVTPRQLSSVGFIPRVTRLLHPFDILEFRNAIGRKFDRHLPAVLRTNLTRVLYQTRYREDFAAAFKHTSSKKVLGELKNRLWRRKAPRTHLHGALSPWQRETPNSTRTVSDKQVRKRLGKRYLPKNWPAPLALKAGDAFAARCRRASIPLVIYEIPSSPLLVKNMDPEVYRRFKEEMQRIAEHHGALFLSQDLLNLKLKQAYFREQSHLNKKGAMRLTNALIQSEGGVRLMSHLESGGEVP